MTEQEAYARLTGVFHDIFMDDSIVLRPDLSAIDVAGWDSFVQIQILSAVQESFSIKISSKEADKLLNVGDLIAVILAH